jgi:hypothetical protein
MAHGGGLWFDAKLWSLFGPCKMGWTDAYLLSFINQIMNLYEIR